MSVDPLVYTKSFGKDYDRLPQLIQEDVNRAIGRFSENPQYPSLHDKKFKNELIERKYGQVRTFRAGRSYRVAYIKKEGEIVLIMVDHRNIIHGRITRRYT